MNLLFLSCHLSIAPPSPAACRGRRIVLSVASSCDLQPHPYMPPLPGPHPNTLSRERRRGPLLRPFSRPAPNRNLRSQACTQYVQVPPGSQLPPLRRGPAFRLTPRCEYQPPGISLPPGPAAPLTPDCIARRSPCPA